MARPRPVPENDFDRSLFEKIDRVGWAVMVIPADDQGPAFAFSLGLFETHGHPEVILIGLKQETMYELVNAIGRRVADGHRFGTDAPADGVLEGFPTWFVPVERDRYWAYLGYANWFYHGFDYPALQCVWPDRHGQFPWYPGVHPGFVAAQPVLGTPPF